MSTPTQDRPPATHVVAGVIEDHQGRILLARRTAGRDLAGLWEFPGGKVDQGETAQAALAREFVEELGIEATIGEPLIAVPQAMPHKRIVLDVYRIAHWRGIPRGLDGQALAWVPQNMLHRYPMPPADRPVLAALSAPDTLLVTPSPTLGDEAAWLARLQHALQNGQRRVQLRAGDYPAANWTSLVGKAVALAHPFAAELCLNGDAALAHQHGIGLHWPEKQLLAAAETPQGITLSASCHSLEALLLAARHGCHYAIIGNIASTPSHPGRAGIGWEAFARLREQVDLPLYAIGGLSPSDIPLARRHGAQGIAAIRSLWPAG